MDDFNEYMNNIYADRDYYSRGKIIDMVKEKYKELHETLELEKDDTREWLQTFNVRIVKASKPTYWYAKHIGEVFEVFYTRKASAALNGMVQVYEQQQLSIQEGDYKKVD